MTRKIVIFCGLRGAGKGTLIEGVMRIFPTLMRLVTHTTRPPRRGEVEGVNYYFVDRDEFEMLYKSGELVARVDISEAQSSGPSKKELLRHEHCVGDISPKEVLPAIQKFAPLHGIELLVLGVLASETLRRIRIREREPGISESKVERLLREDPVTESDTCNFSQFVIHNDKQGDPQSAIDEAAKIIREFLDRG